MELTVSNRTIIRIVVIALLSVVALRILGSLATQIIWFVTALFLALALEPAVDRLARVMPKHSRGLAVAIVILLTFGILFTISIVLLPPFASQLYRLVTGLPAAYTVFAKDNPTAVRFFASHVSSANVSAAIQQFSKQLLSFGGSAVIIVQGIFGGIVAIITVILLTIFMVLEGPRWTDLVWRYMPAAKRNKYRELVRQMHGTVTGYVGGNLLTSVIAAATTMIVLLILHAPYAFALGLLVGVVDLIPMIGATLAAILVCLAVLVFQGLTPAGILVVFFLIYQQVENNILQPIVFSKAVEVSPLVTLVALILGVSLAGFVGALVAIPVAASLQILARYLLSQRRGNHKPAAS